MIELERINIDAEKDARFSFDLDKRRIQDFYRLVDEKIIEQQLIIEGGEKKAWVQTRVRVIVSAHLDRAARLLDGIILLINANNLTAAKPLIKTLMEVVAFFAYLDHIIYASDNWDAQRKELAKLFTGVYNFFDDESNDRRAVRVGNMIQRADSLLMELDPDMQDQKIISYFYGKISNYDHPNFPSTFSVGRIEKNGVWKRAFKDEDLKEYKESFYEEYMPAITITLDFIKVIINKIESHPSINKFEDI